MQIAALILCVGAVLLRFPEMRASMVHPLKFDTIVCVA